ncbi:MAG TPA: tRNA 2-thiouridine(34) synthase MnmA [Candidatus Saccharimonadales bacterium]|nr:tRNA 2-thiouridine(34) synthase MnmA [Candidatus Saccharimonadales bacterium]
MPVSKSVFVGMSGGVDSSVTAALLEGQGYRVTGVYMKNWTEDLPGMQCPWAEDLADAKRVAVQLGIDFKVFDFQDEYRQTVVDYMIEEYKAGRTPNPDVMCNQEIKFKLFLKTALAQGADLIATGHYARVESGQLLTGLDASKDQSYFLYRVDRPALEKTLFPLGSLKKTEVRRRAGELNLVNADKPDSQGICFVGEIGIKDFLMHYVESQPGEIVDIRTREILGEHDGAIFFTIGQRHGLGIGGGLPYYVVAKDMKKNIVYVTSNLDDKYLWKDEITLDQLHWISDEPVPSETYQVRARYRGPLVKASIAIDDGRAVVKLRDAVRGVAAGQSVVVYDGDRVLGGGIVTA